jgi:hypothetical protein
VERNERIRIYHNYMVADVVEISNGPYTHSDMITSVLSGRIPPRSLRPQSGVETGTNRGHFFGAFWHSGSESCGTTKSSPKRLA